MNFFSKILSSNRKKISLTEGENRSFGQLSLEEMEAVLGGRPLVKPSEEQERNILKNINRDI
ncbi:hypothetical protein LV89_04234 [Arcicella aurantiaca]|uniref:Uncharacterized protein n=1 Tax=Arcicella aurantiaca TaxID=591202 RepID=A0A316DMY0_9BACT|nr:hypothetical protein [Arcicella aurantiaca]PWK18083.1 hypothetical protein LV89_04234 [Arcicella aurantiaca]